MTCNSLWAFNAAASFSLCLHMIVVMYTVGVIRPLEKRFGLNALHTAFIMASADLVHTILVLFAGFFFRRGHKPRIIGIATLFMAVGGVLAALPYFLFPQKEEQVYSDANKTLNANPNYQVCDIAENTAEKANMCMRGDGVHVDNSMTAYAIIMVGQIFQGIASAPISSLGIAYLHENTSKNKSYLHIGILSSMYAFGPIIGLGIASFALVIPENSIEGNLLTPDDPRWIGAWYIGFLIVAGLSLIAAIPLLFCFPKRMPDSPHPIMNEGEDVTKWVPVGKQIKEFCPKLKRMFGNGAFMALMFSFVSGTYVVFGVFIQLPRYLEIQFHQPLYFANMVSAVCSAVAGAVGNVLCGVLMMKFKVGAQGAAKFIIMVILIACVGDIILMFYNCPQAAWGGQGELNTHIEPNTTCAAACFCDREKFDPICGADDVTYFSPCHGGCSGVTYGVDDKIQSYYNCTCMTEKFTAEPGMCAKKAPCPMFIAYAVTLFVISFMVNMARVPATVLQIRLIKGDNASFVVAMQSFMTNLLGLIPAPILFGSIIDSLCRLNQERCGRGGACLVYDTETYRWEVHGISGAFLLGALILTIVVWWLIKDRVFEDETAPENQEKAVTNGKSNPAFDNEFDDIGVNQKL